MGAARDLALGSRPWEQRGYDAPWVEFCLKMTQVLRSAGATPVLVFDGCRLPAKAATNQQRRARRADARDRAQKMLQEVRQPLLLPLPTLHCHCTPLVPQSANPLQQTSARYLLVWGLPP